MNTRTTNTAAAAGNCAEDVVRPLRRWQEALVTTAALYPAVLADQAILAPHVRHLPTPVGTLIAIVPVVLAMTYWLHPTATQLLAPLFIRRTALQPMRTQHQEEN